MLDPDAALDVTVHRDFAWWLVPEDGDPSPEVAATLERANKVVMPTEPVGERGAYWVDTGSKAHVRWVRPEPEDALVAAMARLHARGELTLGAESRYAGSFRAHGLLVPVWDLDRELHAKEWAEPVAAVRRPARRGPRRPGAAHRRRAPGPRRAGGQAGHLALSAM